VQAVRLWRGARLRRHTTPRDTESRLRCDTSRTHHMHLTPNGEAERRSPHAVPSQAGNVHPQRPHDHYMARRRRGCSATAATTEWAARDECGDGCEGTRDGLGGEAGVRGRQAG